MANEEESKAPELTDEERVELKQLAELILETRLSEALFEDLVALSYPILAAVKDENPDGTWSAGSGWSSFATYNATDWVLRELLLGADEVDSTDDEIERKLRAAAEVYGADQGPITEDELDELEEIRDERLEPGSISRDEIAAMVGSSVPEFLREARQHGWLDPAAVEAAVDFLEELIGDGTDADGEDFEPQVGDTQPIDFIVPRKLDLSELKRDAQGISAELKEELGTVLADSLGVPVEKHADSEDDLSDDLSADHERADMSDEGEWELAEIAGEDESEHHEELVLEEHHEHHGHSHGDDHVHQILGSEIRGLGDYEGEPADEREIATLALIAEGIIYSELSELFLADFIAEAEPLIRKSRILGPDWWMSEAAALEVADLLSKMLTGESWHPEKDRSAEELTAHRKRIQELAASYPLDPEPAASEEKPSEPSRMSLNEAFADLIFREFGERPPATLVADLAELFESRMLSDNRMFSAFDGHSWSNWGLRTVCLFTLELLGIELDDDDTDEELQAAIRTYRVAELTEDEFIAYYDQSRWPSVGATVDLSIFTILEGKLQVLLIERGNHPERGKWALPGGFVDINESLDQAALRELKEETGVDLADGGYLEQVKTYGYPGRDRRGYIISTLYAALIAELPEPLAGDDAAEARFVPVAEALNGSYELAFDHIVLLGDALERVRAKLEYSPIVFDFLPPGGFTMEELRKVYETVWGFELLPSDFRRRISSAQDALSISEETPDGKILFSRGAATTFFPPLDRRQVLPGSELEDI